MPFFTLNLTECKGGQQYWANFSFPADPEEVVHLDYTEDISFSTSNQGSHYLKGLTVVPFLILP